MHWTRAQESWLYIDILPLTDLNTSEINLSSSVKFRLMFNVFASSKS